jgi:hypothetical protein
MSMSNGDGNHGRPGRPVGSGSGSSAIASIWRIEKPGLPKDNIRDS